MAVTLCNLHSPISASFVSILGIISILNQFERKKFLKFFLIRGTAAPYENAYFLYIRNANTAPRSLLSSSWKIQDWNFALERLTLKLCFNFDEITHATFHLFGWLTRSWNWIYLEMKMAKRWKILFFHEKLCSTTIRLKFQKVKWKLNLQPCTIISDAENEKHWFPIPFYKTPRRET